MKPVDIKTEIDPDILYRRKHEILLGKFNRVSHSNDRLKNRIYHIKKEIKFLKRLKRILIQRLVHNGDRFVEPCLEIPDNEPGTSERKTIAELPIKPMFQTTLSSSAITNVRKPSTSLKSPMVTQTPTSMILNCSDQAKVQQAVTAQKRPAPISKKESRRRSEVLLKTLSDDARASVADIIDEVITESRAERLRSELQQQQSATQSTANSEAFHISQEMEGLFEGIEKPSQEQDFHDSNIEMLEEPADEQELTNSISPLNKQIQ